MLEILALRQLARPRRPACRGRPEAIAAAIAAAIVAAIVAASTIAAAITTASTLTSYTVATRATPEHPSAPSMERMGA